MRAVWGICITVLAFGAAFAQSGDASPTFDAASVKASAPVAPGRGIRVRMGGGPGTKDPGRINWENVALTNVVMQAFDVWLYQISGPDWMSGARFDIAATIQKDATKEQFRVMLQNLLAERFKLKAHREKREMAVYSLVVGKNGPKMKESAEDPAPKPGTEAAAAPRSGPVKMEKDEEGFSIIPGMRGAYTYMTTLNGRTRMRAGQETTPQLATMLTGQLGRPVTDATGLNGKYDFVLTYTAAGRATPSPDGSTAISEADSGADIVGAMQQIGLKLEQKKGMIDRLVIDHVEKVPTEN
jgi:uncharacterized protein (TIGR03435 family)